MSKPPSKGLRDWFERKGIECPKTSEEAMRIYNEKRKRLKTKGEK